MPYIKPDRRSAIVYTEPNPTEWRKVVDIEAIKNAGELNYAITEIISEYYNRDGKDNYQAICDVVGALVGAKDEFQRRVTADYEDLKIAENGDVYDT